MTTTSKHKPGQSSSQDFVEIDRRATESESRGMAIVGQVAGGILHDFNNILTVITGTIDILAQAVEDQPDLAAVARLIDEAATRGARLTAQLLAFARGRPPQPCDLDLDELLADAGRLLRPTLGTEIEISAGVVPGTPTAFADPGQLMAALLSLAIMARDAMGGSGRLEFEARSHLVSDAGADGAAEHGVAIVMKAHANGGAIGRLDHELSDSRVAEDFVGRSNGRLKIGERHGADVEVEILLPRGGALLA